MNKQTKGIFLILIIVIALIITSCDSQSPGMDETAFLAAVDTAVAATDSAQVAEGQFNPRRQGCVHSHRNKRSTSN